MPFVSVSLAAPSLRPSAVLTLVLDLPISAPSTDAPPKRKRGRPPGSKNKKTIAAEAAAAAAGPSTDVQKRPRGRPKKVGLFVEIAVSPPPNISMLTS